LPVVGAAQGQDQNCWSQTPQASELGPNPLAGASFGRLETRAPAAWRPRHSRRRTELEAALENGRREKKLVFGLRMTQFRRAP
jgi:hypothetical protein